LLFQYGFYEQQEAFHKIEFYLKNTINVGIWHKLLWQSPSYQALGSENI